MIMTAGRRRVISCISVALVSGALLFGAPAAGAGQTEEPVAPPVGAGLPDPDIQGRACVRVHGVTVVVDFRDLENARGKRLNLVKIGCANGRQDTGINAIEAAGFDLLHRNGFVCRLDGKPLPAQTDCASEGYWSYWHAERGGAWEFSGEGAGTWVPPRGSFEGWAWSWYDAPAAAPRHDADGSGAVDRNQAALMPSSRTSATRIASS